MDRSPFQLTGFPPNCLCAIFPGYAPRRAIIAPVSRSDKPASLAPALYQSWRSLALPIPFGRSASTRSNPQSCQARRPTSRLWGQTGKPMGTGPLCSAACSGALVEFFEETLGSQGEEVTDPDELAMLNVGLQ